MRRQWRPTPALGRALVVGRRGGGRAPSLVGEPALMVLAAPFVVLATLGLLHRPDPRAAVSTTALDHASLHEGQGTTSRLRVTDADDAEHVTRAAAAGAVRRDAAAGGRVGGCSSSDGPDGRRSARAAGAGGCSARRRSR